MVSQLKSLKRLLAKGWSWQMPPKPWRFLIVTILVIGIFFRFANLENKPYWWDEVINSTHSAGYSIQDVHEQVEAWKYQDLTIKDLHKYQYPNSETSFLDVIRVLANKEPQSPPVYYLLSRWWTQLFGSSVTVQRSLSAFISLLAFPSMYWLCLELFGSSLAAWIGVIIIAISPFHVIFAQEVRMYVLWTVTILLSCASLLRAIRLQRKRDWGIYAASLTLSLYTFPLSILVAIAQGIYVAIAEVPKFFKSIDQSRKARIKISKRFFNYLTASIASMIAYAPWIVFLIQIDETKMLTWRQRTITFSELLKNWLFQTSIIFADLNPEYLGGNGGSDYGIESFYDPLSFYPMIFIWGIILYSLYFLVCNSPKSIWSFILPLILVTALVLVLPDLIFGGIRSTISRYLIPCYLGIQLSIVNLIYLKINFQSNTILQKKYTKKIWQLVLAMFLSIQVISCSVIIQSPSWWNKSILFQNIPIANIINSVKNPLILIILSGNKYSWIDLMTISHNLNNHVTIRFIDRLYLRETDTVFSDKFIFNAPEEWLDLIKKGNKLKVEEIYKGDVVEDSDPDYDSNFSLVRIL